MQTAIEYEASAIQAYRLGQVRLDAALGDPRWSALTEQGAEPPALPPAVILDIDETVLDNSYYQARLVHDDATFANDTWEAWCLESRATAIPGAVEFTRVHRVAGRHGFLREQQNGDSRTGDPGEPAGARFSARRPGRYRVAAG